MWWRLESVVRERAEDQVAWKGEVQVSVGEGFGEMRWTVVKAISGGKVLGCSWFQWWKFG